MQRSFTGRARTAAVKVSSTKSPWAATSHPLPNSRSQMRRMPLMRLLPKVVNFTVSVVAYLSTSRRTRWYWEAAAKSTTQTSVASSRMSSIAPLTSSRSRFPLHGKSRQHLELKVQTRHQVVKTADSSEMLRVDMLREAEAPEMLAQMTVAHTSRISSSRAARRVATMSARCLSHKPSTASLVQTTTIVTTIE